jgi:hypothetical protein
MYRLCAALLVAVGTALASPSAGTQVHPLPGEEGLSLSLEFAEPVFEELDGRRIARLPDEGFLGRPGEPDLPLVVRLVRIPARSAVELEVVATHWLPLGLQEIRPLQDRLHTEAELPLSWLEDPASYGRAGWYPGEWLQLSDPLLVRETRLVQLAIAPLRWNPVSGELQRLERLELRLHFRGASEINNPLRASDEGVSDDDSGLVYRQRQAEAAFIGALLGHRLLNPVAHDAPASDPLSSIGYLPPPLPLNYLVFARQTLVAQSSFANWLEWKRSKGHHVTVVTDQSIGGTWSISNIRGRIVSEYTGSEHPPHYVALFGDTGGSYSLPTHSSQYDHYFSTIAGNDILADVVVGRISVESATQLATVINKILAYERSPYLDQPGWLRRASFLTGTGHCGLSMSQLSRSIAFDLVEERGYTQIDTAFCANSPSYVYSWINQGISFYNYRGWAGMEGLSRNQLLALSQGPRTPVAVIYTCSSGDFADDWNGLSYTEAFFRSGTPTQLGGAVASMGFCTPYTNTACNNVVSGGFWSGMLDYQVSQLGTCMFRGKYDLFLTLPPNDNNTASFSYWANLIGDPGMELWCGVPGALDFEGLGDTLAATAQTLALRVLDAQGQPAAGAAVCAYQSEHMSVLGLTDEDGRVWLEIPEPAGGPLLLTASRAWEIPVQRSLQLLDDLAQPVLAGLVINDAGLDGIWQPGEAAALTPSFRNPSATATLPPMTVLLSLRDEASGELLEASATLPALAPGASVATSSALQLQAAPDWTLGAPLDLRFSLSGAEQVFEVLTRVALDSPRIGMTESSFPAGALEPGGSALLRIELHNGGTLDAPSLPGLFSLPEGSGLSLGTPELMLPALAAGATAQIEMEISASPVLVPGYTAPLSLAWGEPAGPRGVSTVAVALGSGAPGDPTGPDAYGYYAFESTDTAWAQAPVYSWIEIAPNAGGDGTLVELNDYGDEQDDSRRVELPFPFMLYGRVYQSLAVCSNGFVAFGESAHLESDFRNHFLPSGMGPDPMLAPMWDDHKLAGDAQVCTRYFPESGLFVVEWYRMRSNSNNRINTFQLILHDAAHYPTPSGDGDVVFQWHTWDDNQSNSQDFPYCTVGLKDHSATVGLTLRNYLREPATVEGIGAGRAVRLTTNIRGDVEPAQLVLDTPALHRVLEPGMELATSDSLELGNQGGAPLIWQARVLQPADWPPFEPGGTRESGGPDETGYGWIDSEEPEGPAAGWVDVWEASQTLLFSEGNDGVAGPFAPGFAMPFYGESHDQVWISANGFISFAEPDAPYWQNNGGLPDVAAPPLALLPWWDDLFNDEHDVAQFVRAWSNGLDSLVVTWNEAPHYNQTAYGGPFTFQIVVEGNGRIAFNYGAMAEEDDDSDSGTIGITGSEGQGFAIRHMQRSRDELTIRIRPPFWLSVDNGVGLVGPGANGAVRLRLINHVAGQLLPEGEYTALVRLTTNDPDQAMVDVPVTLLVGYTNSESAVLPSRFALGEPRPNPFNPMSRVSLALPAAGPVHARVYNLLGQEALRILEGRILPAGEHELSIDGSGLASGLYILRVEALGRSETRRLLLLK